MKKLMALALTIFSIFSVNSSVKAMNDGWSYNNSNWYYYKNGNVIRKNWIYVGKNWYYFDENGVMQTDWEKLDGYWYSFTPSGEMRTGWFKDGNTWYSLANSGYMRTGWYKEKNTWYYLKSSGTMAIGWQSTYKNGETLWSYFNDDGSMRYGDIVDYKGIKYILDYDGYLSQKREDDIELINHKFYFSTYREDLKSAVVGTNCWYFDPMIPKCENGEPKILKYLIDFKRPNEMIDAKNIVRNIQNYDHKMFFGKDGEQVKNPPLANINAEIVKTNGELILKNQDVKLNCFGFGIVNGKLVEYRNLDSDRVLSMGYRAVVDDRKENGTSILTFSDENGEVVKMKRLSDRISEVLNREIDGFFGDKIIIDDNLNVKVVNVKE